MFEDLKRIWHEDDMLGLMMILLFFVPTPFLYAALDNMLNDYTSLMVSLWTFVLNIGLWFGVYSFWQSSEDESEEDELA